MHINLDGVMVAIADDGNTIAAQQHCNSINSELQALRELKAKQSDRLDSLKTESEALKADLSTLKASLESRIAAYESLESTHQKLVADHDELVVDRSDSADGKSLSETEIATLIRERMRVWTESLPLLRSDSPDYEPDYSLKPIAVMAEAVKVANPDLAGHIDSLDLDDPEGAGFVKGLYAGVNSSQFMARKKSGVDHVDSILEEIRRQRESGVVPGNESVRLDAARSKRTDRIKNNGLGGAV